MTHLFSRLLSLLVLFLLALRLPAAAQAPAWQSARAVAVATAATTANNYSVVTATAVDAAGNVYLAGYFNNTVVLGSTTLTSLGSSDVFVAKFNSVSNQFVWAQRAGGTDDEQATALAVSGTSVYVAGYFVSPTAGFGPATLTNAGSADIFVAELTDAGSTGSFGWAQQAGGVGPDYASALAGNGTSVYVAGYCFSFPAAFGTTTLTNAGQFNGYVAKLTDAGSTASFGWAQSAGGMNNIPSALAVSGDNVYIAGYFANPTAVFGATTLTNPNPGTDDVYVAKLTDAGSTGSFVWAQSAGGTGGDEVNALAVSGTSVYIAGPFSSSTASFGTITLSNAGSVDGYVAKLTDAGSTGSFGWAQRSGGTEGDYANGLAVSGTSVYVAGNFTSPTAGFGPITLTNAGFADVFVTKLTDAGSTGSFVWAQRAGSTGNDYARRVFVSGTSVYVTGSFTGSTTGFGPITLSNPNPGTPLNFLATITDATPTATTAAGPREPGALFPNPAHHTATLRLPAGAARVPLTLIDALGRAARHFPAPTSPEATLDLRGLPAGLYLLRGAGPARRLLVE
jgi:hypothetical protein